MRFQGRYKWELTTQYISIAINTVVNGRSYGEAWNRDLQSDTTSWGFEFCQFGVVELSCFCHTQGRCIKMV